MVYTTLQHQSYHPTSDHHAFDLDLRLFSGFIFAIPLIAILFWTSNSLYDEHTSIQIIRPFYATFTIIVLLLLILCLAFISALLFHKPPFQIAFRDTSYLYNSFLPVLFVILLLLWNLPALAKGITGIISALLFNGFIFIKWLFSKIF